MPVWSWFFIAAGVLIALTLILVAVLSVTGRRKTERLKEHFGAEYERAVDTPAISAPPSRSSLPVNRNERSSTSSSYRPRRINGMPSSGPTSSARSSTIRQRQLVSRTDSSPR